MSNYRPRLLLQEITISQNAPVAPLTFPMRMLRPRWFPFVPSMLARAEVVRQANLFSNSSENLKQDANDITRHTWRVISVANPVRQSLGGAEWSTGLCAALGADDRLHRPP